MTHTITALLLILSVYGLISCSGKHSKYNSGFVYQQDTPIPYDISNICSIFIDKPVWYNAAHKSSTKWGVPIYVMMAIIRHESSFIAHARPKNPKSRSYRDRYLTSAYGYAQAIDATWRTYQKSTGNKYAKRHDFADSIDFVGWYIDASHKKNSIHKYRADLLYLNYHEGWMGYMKQSYLKKLWLLETAQEVEATSLRYKTQLRSCALKNKPNDPFVVDNSNNKGKPSWF